MTSGKSKEDLIAYLDGELPDEAASNVEKTLAEDAAVRRDVEQLSRTYDLLDLLPSGKASDNFTEKTLTAIRTQTAVGSPDESTAASSAAGSSTFRQKSMVWGIRAVAFLGLLIVAAAGFNGAFRRGSEPIDELLTELPLIERLDEYREVGDVEFLRQLSESGLFDERVQPAPD